MVLALLAILAFLAVCIHLGMRPLSRFKFDKSRVLLGTGIVLGCIFVLLILGCVLMLGPGRNRIVAQGTSPSGLEYCIVQTYKNFAEPYQVSFYIRDVSGTWRWNYLAHQDSAWHSAAVIFDDHQAHVKRDGVPFRDIALPTNTVDLTKVQPGYREDYFSSNFTPADLLTFHNQRFKQ